MQSTTTTAICGAGIAGIATAYYLLKASPTASVVLIDKQQPLSFTTSKSGENFRDYWPQAQMRDFVSESLELMNELRTTHGPDAFKMVYSGYNFVSHDAEKSVFGVNDQAVTDNQLEEINDVAVLRRDHAYLDQGVEKITRVKNAGHIDVYALGSLLLKEARAMGLRQETGEIVGMNTAAEGYTLSLASGETIVADKVVIAAGPFLNHLAGMLELAFPVFNIPQRKFIIPDPLGVIPTDMPFTIYADSQYLGWSDEERAFFKSEPQHHWLLNEFPGGLHIKPDAGGIKMGWAFQTEPTTPKWEMPTFDFFPQTVLKGASRFIPGLAAYEKEIPTPLIEYAGYYTRTKENWPLVGPTAKDGIFVVGALAGYGTMSACAAGKLCAAYVSNAADLPAYAAYFHPLRYDDPVMMAEIENARVDGQL